MERYGTLDIQASGAIELNGGSVGTTLDFNTYPFLRDIPVFFVTGSVSTAAATSVIDSSPVDGWQSIFIYTANVTTNTVSFFGTTLSALQATKSSVIHCSYQNGAFSVIINPSASNTGYITTGDLANNSVTNAKLSQVSTQTFKGRTTAGTGDPEDLTVAQAKALLNLAGTNTGDQTITLTGAVTGSGTGSFTTTIPNASVALGKLVAISDQTILGNTSGGSAVPSSQTASQVRGMLGIVRRVIHVPVSFESGEQSRNEVIVPYNGTLERAGYCITKALSGTDDANIVIQITSSFGGGATPVAGGNFTIPASTAINTVSSQSLTAFNTLTNEPNNYIVVESSKVIPGGKAIVSIVILTSS